MGIELQNAGKKFIREWIFRHVDLKLANSDRVVVLGPNGSGKSTFLQTISGALIPTEGKIIYSDRSGILDPESIFRKLCIAAPYLELMEEFTLAELIDFHFSFKKPLPGLTIADVIHISGLSHASSKVFRYFSSGMKQRVKLTLALLSDVRMVLLDEPCSNLDDVAVQWYKELVATYAGDKFIMVCSNNQPDEFGFCNRKLNMLNLNHPD